MSFHESLTNAQLPGDLIGVGGASFLIGSTAQVYTGRRPRTPHRVDGEIWIERMPAEEIGTGLQRLTAYPYRLHCYSATDNKGPDKSGDQQLDEVEQMAAGIVAQYHGTRRLYSALPEIALWHAAEESIDYDPEARRAEAVVSLTAYVKG